MDRDEGRRALDRLETADLARRYAQAVDERSWDRLRGMFEDEIEADFRSFGAREVYRGSADGWIEAVRETVGGMQATRHVLASHAHSFAGPDACTLASGLVAEHLLRDARGDARYAIGGAYVWRLRRRAGGWRIAAYALAIAWARGERRLLAASRRRARPPG